MSDETKVIVYDLNETLYQKSSKEEFFKFICYKRGYKLFNLLELAGLKILGKLRLIDITSFKENFFDYLDHLPPEVVERYARQFWSIEYPQHFHPELLEEIEQLKDSEIKLYIITGGLEVYTRPLLHFLPIEHLLGTRTEYVQGDYKVLGEACKNEEKTRRLSEDLGSSDYRLLKAYSDEKEDLLNHAEQAFLVDDGEINTYNG